MLMKSSKSWTFLPRKQMGFSGGTQASNIHTAYSNPNGKLVAEKLKEWEWFHRFLESNPDVKERYETHKTYEILNDTRDR
jgi:hypothetical protein